MSRRRIAGRWAEDGERADVVERADVERAGDELWDPSSPQMQESASESSMVIVLIVHSENCAFCNALFARDAIYR